MFKKVLAVALAATMVCSMATVASANVEGVNGQVKYKIGEDFATDIDAKDIDSVTVVLKADQKVENSFNGNMAYNPTDGGWFQKSFSASTSDLDWQGNPYDLAWTVVDEYTVSVTYPYTEASDLTGGTFVIGDWNDYNWTVVSVTANTKAAPATGAVAPIAIVSVVALASTAVLVSRKRA